MTGDDGTQLVFACDLRRGDHVHQSRENGRSAGGTTTVLAVRQASTAVTIVTTWTGDHEYRTTEPVTIDRRQSPTGAVLANLAAVYRPQIIAAGYDPDDPDLTAKMEADTRPLLEFYGEA